MALIEFYGDECSHCLMMAPLVARLEKELKLKVKRLECWHDEKNEKLREKSDPEGECGGVPFFVNEESGKKLCGEVDYATLKAWAAGA